MATLNVRDQMMLAGQLGETTRLAMSIIVRMANILEVDELIDVTQAHIDACGLKSVSGLEFVELLANSGGKVAVPTTLNMIPLDLDNWKTQGIDREYADFVQRMANAYLALGCIPTWTCAPYQGYLTPRFGQQIVWGESNAIVYANSVLGARTERYADFMDICGAITGRVPKYGLHIKENRKGQVLFRLIGFEPNDFLDRSIFPILGYLIGGLTKDRVPVIDGVEGSVPNHCLKALGAAAASSGAVGIFHMIGITPEANTLDEAFQGQLPEEVVEVYPETLKKTRGEMGTSLINGKQLDAVIIGCPHFSYDEFVELAEAIEISKGKCHSSVYFVVMTNQTSLGLIKRTGIFDTINKFGVKILLDSCVFHTPILPKSLHVIMTNSGKCAYYSPGELGVEVIFGDVYQCVRSAITGTICSEDVE